MRRGVPGRRDQADRGRRRAVGAQAALHRLLELRAGVPVRRAEVRRRVRPDDEVRHVLRPHVGGAQADVRLGVPERGAVVRHARAVRPPPDAARCCATSCSAARTCGRRCAPSSTTSTAGPLDVLGADARRAGTTTRSGSRRRDGDGRRATPRPDLAPGLPVRGGRRGGGHPARVRPLPRARRRGDRRRQRRPRRVDPAAVDQHRRPPGDRRRSPSVAVGATYLFRYPSDRRPGDPAPRRRPGGASRSARSARTSAASSTSSPTPDRWHCPCHEGNFDARHRRRALGPADAAARPHRRRDPRRRHDLGARRRAG